MKQAEAMVKDKPRSVQSSSENSQEKLGQQLKSGYRNTGYQKTQEAKEEAVLILNTDTA